MESDIPPSGANNFWHPAHLVATVFGIGNLPKAPGTWGSLVALPAAWLIVTNFGITGLFIGIALVIPLGVWAASEYAVRTGTVDAGAVVIDEVAGQWLTLVLVPPDLIYYLLGFLLFRLADIYKPWPISWADRNIKGGLGVMLDDLMAGVPAAAILYGIVLLRGGI